MDVPLHPDLARLEAQYDRVVSDYEQNAISYEQAQASVAALTAVDGTGALWSINLDGDWVRRATPDAPALLADPVQFTPAQLPPRPGEPAGAPWLAPPPGSGPSGQPDLGTPGLYQQPGTPVSPGWGTGTGPLPSNDQLFSTRPTAERGRRAGRPAATGRRLPAVPAVSSLAQAPAVAGVVAKVKANKKTTVVVAAGLLLVLAAVGHRSHPGPGPAGSIPSATSAPTGFPTQAASPSVTPSVKPAPKPPALPSAADTRAVLVALQSGRRASAARAVADPGTPAQVAFATAELAGLKVTGLSLRAGAATAGPAGVTQPWAVVDTASGRGYATIVVHWRRTGTGWKLTSWPALPR